MAKSSRTFSGSNGGDVGFGISATRCMSSHYRSIASVILRYSEGSRGAGASLLQDPSEYLRMTEQEDLSGLRLHRFVERAEVRDPQVLRQPVLGGHEVFQSSSHRFDLDATRDVGGERVAQQMLGGLESDA